MTRKIPMASRAVPTTKTVSRASLMLESSRTHRRCHGARRSAEEGELDREMGDPQIGPHLGISEPVRVPTAGGRCVGGRSRVLG
jgi:hypothetical protein